jgi:hypothetical protein
MNGGSFGLLMFFANEVPFGLGLSEVLQIKLSSVKPGARVGVLRTDTAFHVRTIKNAEDGTH